MTRIESINSSRLPDSRPINRLERYEAIESVNGSGLTDSAQNTYVLCLFIAGSSPRSSQAVANVRKLCADSLPGVCDLEVVDILQQPQAAKDNQIIAVPTLIKKLPNPVRLFVGDMSNGESILQAMGA